MAVFRELLREDLDSFVKNFRDDESLDSNAGEIILDDSMRKLCMEEDLSWLDVQNLGSFWDCIILFLLPCGRTLFALWV